MMKEKLNTLHEKLQSNEISEQEALKQIKELTKTREPLAIVGISGEFPMARDVIQFWENLNSGKDCISEIPSNRWDWREIYGDPQTENNKTNIKWGGFIDGIAEFDPLFFNVTPQEAGLMDPQQRLLMIHAWKALEDAGYAADSLSGSKTAIFVGTTGSGYLELIAKSNVEITKESSTGIVPSIGPNRTSFFLNFHGPSEPIETAGSSSLVALHRAAISIESGICDKALVGGINTLITPERHIHFSKAGMLSEDGRCKSFSSKANGYVPSEAVGMIFVKKLADAEQDRDQIYCVIRGTAENHGGRADSLTTPNPKAQSELLKSAYTRAGIDPRTVSYIEAHGIGRELGDKVEIDALKTAFAELYRETEDPVIKEAHCGIGSVKTNIGHAELASGIMGVIKVLLQLKYKRLVKNLHCDEIHPDIQLEGSPFYMVRETVSWKALTDKEGNELPRRAGISSFGFGGTSAHVVVEEYPQNRSEETAGEEKPEPYLIVLSAKTEDRLKATVKNILRFTLESAPFSLFDFAYTLQVGRNAMEERLALVVTSIKELREKLEGFLYDQKDISDLYRGTVQGENESLAVFSSDEELREAIEKWMDRGKVSKLLEMWVKGLPVDWSKLYKDKKPRRISLPTYPFAQSEYWLLNTKSRTEYITTDLVTPVIHPLLHTNCSDFSEQRFSSTFTGNEFFLSDHRINGQKVLPGVASLEMARAAIETAIENIENSNKTICLKDIIWNQPFVVEKASKIQIALFPQKDGEINWEIFTDEEDDGPEKIITFGQGRAVRKDSDQDEVVDLKTLEEQCNLDSLSAEKCYKKLETARINYGPSLQGLTTVLKGEKQAIAKLSIPVDISESLKNFVLHPTLTDAALQASIGLLGGNFGSKPPQPFSLKELQVLGPCNDTMWAVVRYSDGSPFGKAVRKLDIDLCDETGKIAVRMREFSFRPLELKSISDASSKPANTLMLRKDWTPDEKPETKQPESEPTYIQHQVIFCELSHTYREGVKTELGTLRCLLLQSEDKEIEKRFEMYALRIMEEIQIILKARPKNRVLLQVVIPNVDEQLLLSGLSGMLKTAHVENENLIGQLIAIEPKDSPKEVCDKLKECGHFPMDQYIRYQDGKRLIPNIREINFSKIDRVENLPWKDRGFYLITGGVGGLGLIFANEIVQQVKEPTLILADLTSPDEQKTAQLTKLQTAGAKIEYRQVDVNNQEAVNLMVETIQTEFGPLHGIIHSAGVLRDNFIFKKSKNELQEVLACKVAGTVHLDYATRDMALDFFVLFSSTLSMGTYPGLSDYSTGSAFMDNFSEYRNKLVKTGKRSGHTLSINWPHWKDGGIIVDEKITKEITKKTGIVPMETATGIFAFYRGLASGLDQVMVMEGDVPKIKKSLSLPEAKQPETVETEEKSTHQFSVQLKSLLSEVTSELLQIEPEEIDWSKEFNGYGFDSTTLTRFINILNREYGLELSPTIFFEQVTLNDFINFLQKEYESQFSKNFESGKKEIGRDEILLAEKRIKAEGRSEIAKRRARFVNGEAQTGTLLPTQSQEPIAVVGMSGRFPMAKEINDFWNNIAEGKNCTIEIPKERWNWKEFYGDPKREAFKTTIKWGGFIDGIEEFDPLFFDITERESKKMDPQQRLLITWIWKALENGAIIPKTFSEKKTGVFVATGAVENVGAPADLADGTESLSSTGSIMLPNRISQTFNLQGPSEFYDTSSSSTLVALHRAIQSIRNDECEQAVIGAITLLLSPSAFIGLESVGYLSPEGQTKSFQTDAKGFVRSEGVGAIIIKPLRQAIADQNIIHAIIKGTGIAHGGKTKTLTTPSETGMKSAMKQAWQSAGIAPNTISYIEAYGIASPNEDEIEINALKSGYLELVAEYTGNITAEIPCHIGSLTPVIGNGDAVSGMASLIKVISAMNRQYLPPIPNLKKLNEKIQLNDSPFLFLKEGSHWDPLINKKGHALPRRAAINSFGLSGVNAHVVLEEHVSKPYIPENGVMESEAQIMLFSARNQKQLIASIQNMIDFLNQNQELSLPNMAYTLQVGREAMESRVAMVIKDQDELIHGLTIALNRLENKGGDESSVPLFIGDTDKEHSELKTLLSGKAGETVVQLFLKENDLEKLALHWTQGGEIQWEKLYQENAVQKISLPSYPFEQTKFPLSLFSEAQSIPQLFDHEEKDMLLVETSSNFLKERVIQIFSDLLNVTEGELELDKSLDQYGLDSIQTIQLLQRLLTTIDPLMTPEKLSEFKTIRDVIERVSPKQALIPRSDFPKMIHLNQIEKGQPTFWIHPEFGEVDSYRLIAQKIKTPFYGIQSRELTPKQTPLRGFREIAQYHLQTIKSVQPEGPYHLGGFSLGGFLAYEIARQLQHEGEKVNSIIMIDSPDKPNIKTLAKDKNTRKNLFLQLINNELIASIQDDSNQSEPPIISRKELNVEQSEKSFRKELIELAKKHGLPKTEEQLMSMFEHVENELKGLEAEPFTVYPLPDPKEVDVYYFRNRSGQFLGDLEPYYLVQPEDSVIGYKDHTNYWTQWKENLPNLHIIDVDASNHITLLAEPKVNKTISELCEVLYSQKEITEKFMKKFKKKAKEKHGSMKK